MKNTKLKFHVVQQNWITFRANKFGTYPSLKEAEDACARLQQSPSAQWYRYFVAVPERTQFLIDKKEFDEHNVGTCDPTTCSNCYTFKIAPDKWIARGANDPEAEYVRD